MRDILDTGASAERTGNEKLPNSSGVLVLGIIGLVLFFNIIGLVCSIIAVSMASGALRAYNEDPMRYDETSYKQVKSGRTCGVIGMSLFGFAVIVVLLIIAAMEL